MSTIERVQYSKMYFNSNKITGILVDIGICIIFCYAMAIIDEYYF